MARRATSDRTRDEPLPLHLPSLPVDRGPMRHRNAVVSNKVPTKTFAAPFISEVRRAPCDEPLLTSTLLTPLPTTHRLLPTTDLYSRQLLLTDI